VVEEIDMKDLALEEKKSKKEKKEKKGSETSISLGTDQVKKEDE